MYKQDIDITLFVKENYLIEIDRKDKISSRINQPITALTILIGLIGAISKDIKYPFNAIEAMQIIALAASIYYIAKSIYYLIKFTSGYKYKYLPTTLTILKYYNDLKNYKSTNNEFDPETHFLEYMQRAYSESAHKNAINNDDKLENLYILNNNLLLSLVPVSTLGIFYLINNIFIK